MVSILLIILKIIGITLLVVIGLILLILLLVLFVPVRYKAEGGYEEAFYCKAKVTWLLHFISVKIDVGEEVNTSIRILGIPLSLFKKKRDESTKRDKKLTAEDADKTGNEQEKPSQSGECDHESAIIGDNDEMIENHETVDSVTTTEESESVEQNGEKKSFFDKIKDKFHGIIKKIKGILEKVCSIPAKINNFINSIEDKKKNVKRYIRILKSDIVKTAFAVCKQRIGNMLKHILPKKMLVNIHYGLEDPANTGYILGVYGLLPEFIGKRFVLYPDFEHSLFKCDFRMKGAIRMWTLLYQLLRVIFDENCRKLYYIVKKEISNE